MGLDFDFSKLDTMDILDIAIYVEREAAANYEELAAWCAGDAPDSAAFFTRMAGWERLHGDQLSQRRQALFGDTPPNLTDVGAWEVETPDYGKVGAALSITDALRVAFEAEKNAELYYAEAIEYITDEETVFILENLRDSEVEHQRLLEAEIAKH